jgi:hypothetical protein
VSTDLRTARRRLIFLLPGVAALVAGLWGGLLRIPVLIPWPVEHAYWVTHHGALMVSGFFGTLIGVERAVGARARWAWGAPVVTGAGAIVCISGQAPEAALLLFVVGGAWFTAVNAVIAWKSRHLFTALMAVAACAWVVGNVLFWRGALGSEAVWWWCAFLAWTIVAERLELTRLVKLPALARPALIACMCAQVAGTIGMSVGWAWAPIVAGAALTLQALWLLRHDIARRNVRLGGLPGFSAACLLLGYVWLALAGACLAALSPLQAGASYDAALHAFFLGFVFAMIFGHAPIIFPAVLNVPMRFTRWFYVHVVLMQITLAVRIAADLTGAAVLRQWGAIGNVTTIALFLMVTLVSVVVGVRRAR